MLVVCIGILLVVHITEVAVQGSTSVSDHTFGTAILRQTEVDAGLRPQEPFGQQRIGR